MTRPSSTTSIWSRVVDAACVFCAVVAMMANLNGAIDLVERFSPKASDKPGERSKRNDESSAGLSHESTRTNRPPEPPASALAARDATDQPRPGDNVLANSPANAPRGSSTVTANHQQLDVAARQRSQTAVTNPLRSAQLAMRLQSNAAESARNIATSQRPLTPAPSAALVSNPRDQPTRQSEPHDFFVEISNSSKRETYRRVNRATGKAVEISAAEARALVSQGYMNVRV